MRSLALATIVLTLSMVSSKSVTANPVVSVGAREVLRRAGIWIAEQTLSWVYGKVLDKAVGTTHTEAMANSLRQVQAEIKQLQMTAPRTTLASSERDRINAEMAATKIQQLQQLETALQTQARTLDRLMRTKVDRAEADLRHREVLRSLRELEDTYDVTNERLRLLEERILKLEARPNVDVAVSSSVSTSVSVILSEPPSWFDRRRARKLSVNGDRLLERDAVLDAIESYDNALRIDPDNVDAYVGRANAHMRKEAYDAALADLRSAISRDESRDDALMRRASIYLKLEQYSNAIADLTSVLNARRRYRETALLARGFAYAMSDNKSAALADFAECTAIAPASSEAGIARAALVLLSKR